MRARKGQAAVVLSLEAVRQLMKVDEVVLAKQSGADGLSPGG